MQCGGRVGKNHTLGRGVADVALMPEGDVFEGGHGVAAQDAGKPTNALGFFWIALVGHCGGALLVGSEWLEGFAELGALEVAKLKRHLIEGGADEREGGDEVGVTVALNDLGGDGRRTQAKLVADEFFDAGWDSGMGADGARDSTDGDIVYSSVETGAGAA